MQVRLVIFSPRLQRFGLGADSGQKIVVFHQKIRGVEPTDCVGKPVQRFFVSHFVGKVLHNQSPARDQAICSSLHRFIQRMNVVKRTSEEDSVELPFVKIGPGSISSVHAELPRGSNTIRFTIDRDDRQSVLAQACRQFARTTANLQNTSRMKWKRLLNEVVGDPGFEVHAELFPTRRLRFAAQDLFSQARFSACITLVPSTDANLNLIVTGGAGFIGSNLVLELQERFPNSRLSAVDDFRSGDFKNLRGYRGDFIAADLAKLNWRERFGDEKFDAIFHLASITDTTNHNQFEQTHDNVESFRRLLEFARPTRTRVIFASSASIYGATTEASTESTDAAPANIYAFSKAIMDNIATRLARENPDWTIIGVRYFNVYGPREAHKGVPASMIYHLSQQMHAGQRPRIFKHGEQRRDFVYVKDVVDGTIRGLDANKSGIYNLGSGQARSFNELIFILNRVLQTNLQPDYFDNPHAHYQNFTQADLTNAKAALGYESRYTLEEGVQDYMRWLYPEKLLN
jgi:ADP-L-glycero-D-manno-heptose 6-epimerase